MKNNRTLICKFMILAMLITSSLIMSTSCKSGENGEVYVLCYGDYFDLDLVDKFEAETGIKVITEYYDTAEDMYTKFENDSTTYDCICTSDYMIQRMIENDMLDALDNNNIPEKEIATTMIANGVHVQEVTIRGWLDEDSHTVGPRREDSIQQIALLIEDTDMFEKANIYYEACATIRRIRRDILSQIGRAIIDRLIGREPTAGTIMADIYERTGSIAQILRLESISNVVFR